jgi:putative metallohydrolase (TIGR04338 family)
MREMVVLHELAHQFAVGERHGPEFVANYARIVTEVIGPEAGLLPTSALNSRTTADVQKPVAPHAASVERDGPGL